MLINQSCDQNIPLTSVPFVKLFIEVINYHPLPGIYFLCTPEAKWSRGQFQRFLLELSHSDSSDSTRYIFTVGIILSSIFILITWWLEKWPLDVSPDSLMHWTHLYNCFIIRWIWTRIPFITWLCELPHQRSYPAYDLRSLGIDVSSDLLCRSIAVGKTVYIQFTRSSTNENVGPTCLKISREWWYSLKPEVIKLFPNRTRPWPNFWSGSRSLQGWRYCPEYMHVGVLDVSISRNPTALQSAVLDVKINSGLYK